MMSAGRISLGSNQKAATLNCELSALGPAQEYDIDSLRHDLTVCARAQAQRRCSGRDCARGYETVVALSGATATSAAITVSTAVALGVRNDATERCRGRVARRVARGRRYRIGPARAGSRPFGTQLYRSSRSIRVHGLNALFSQLYAETCVAAVSTCMFKVIAKGPLKNNFTELAPRFASDLVATD